MNNSSRCAIRVAGNGVNKQRPRFIINACGPSKSSGRRCSQGMEPYSIEPFLATLFSNIVSGEPPKQRLMTSRIMVRGGPVLACGLIFGFVSRANAEYEGFMCC